MIVSLLFIILASFFLGTFGLGMKYNKPLSWEAFWGIHAITAMLLVPAIWAITVIPHPIQSIAHTPLTILLRGGILGFLWGIGGVMFGLSVKYVGVSLTYGVVMGTTGIIGALVPLLRIEDFYKQQSFPFIIAGMLVMIISIIIITYAGIKRENSLSHTNSKIEGIKKGKEFRKGLLIVYVAGIFSSLLNIGFDAAYPVAENAVDNGASEIMASILVWVVVLWGAIFFNLLYSITLLFRNNSWKSFLKPQSGKAWFWAITSGIFWFFSMAFYGLGAAKMGEFGTVLGWPVFVGLSLLFSNFWAIRAGEWANFYYLKKILFLGVLVMIIATAILSYANTF